jgi:hypothetical protein
MPLHSIAQMIDQARQWLTTVVLGCGLSAGLILVPQLACAQASSEIQWGMVATLVPQPGSDHVSLKAGGSLKAGATMLQSLGQVLLQSVDGPVYIRHVAVVMGTETIDIPVRRILAAGETAGPFVLKAPGRGLITALTVHVQPDAQASGRIAVLAPTEALEHITQQAAHSRNLANDRAGLTLIAASTIQPLTARTAVRLGPSKGRLTHILLRLRSGTLALQAVRVLHVTGETQMLAMDRTLGPGDATVALPLERDAFVAEVQVIGTAQGSARTVLDVYGQLADGWTGDAGESKTYTAGWVLIGLRRPSRDGAGGDDARVTADLGRFKKLKFTARDGAVTLTTATVVFDDGDQTSVSIGQTLTKDQTSQPVGLVETGPGRGIAAVILPPASKTAMRRDGYVEVWGQN